MHSGDLAANPQLADDDATKRLTRTSVGIAATTIHPVADHEAEVLPGAEMLPGLSFERSEDRSEHPRLALARAGERGAHVFTVEQPLPVNPYQLPISSAPFTNP